MGPTFSEQRLIKQMQKMLSPFLSKFLLTGYGENKIVYSRFFYTIEAKPGIEQKKLVGVTSNDPAGLPFKKEPLVLMAALTLLKYKDDRTGINPIVPFPTGEIMGALEWDNTDEISLIINSAIRKYFNLSYVHAIDPSSSFPGASGITCDISRLVVSYMFSSESGLDAKVLNNELEDMACMEIGFSQQMVEDLMAKQFLGIDWDSVISLEQVPP